MRSAIARNVGLVPTASGYMITAGHGPSPSGSVERDRAGAVRGGHGEIENGHASGSTPIAAMRAGSAISSMPATRPSTHGERERHAHLAAVRPDQAGLAVEEGEAGGLGAARRTSRPRRRRRAPRLRPPRHGGGVGADDGVGVEQRQERGEVAAARGGEERGDDLPPPPRRIRRRVIRAAAVVGREATRFDRVRVRLVRSRALHPPPRPAGQLPGRGGRAADDRADLVERHGEQVVQDERQPLGGRERVQHDQQRGPDRVGQHRLALRPGLGRDALVGRERLLPARGPRAQHVQAHPRDDRREPSPQVVHAVDVGAGQPQPRLLHGVVGLGARAEHAVGHRRQVRPAVLEPLRQHVHRSHLPSGFRHLDDGRGPVDVTALR